MAALGNIYQFQATVGRLMSTGTAEMTVLEDSSGISNPFLESLTPSILLFLEEETAIRRLSLPEYLGTEPISGPTMMALEDNNSNSPLLMPLSMFQEVSESRSTLFLPES